MTCSMKMTLLIIITKYLFDGQFYMDSHITFSLIIIKNLVSSKLERLPPLFYFGTPFIFLFETHLKTRLFRVPKTEDFFQRQNLYS